MRKILATLTIFVVAVIGGAGTGLLNGHAGAAGTCLQWSNKPTHRCVKYGTPPTTTTSTTTTVPPTTTTQPPVDTSLCDLGSDARQAAHDDALHYVIYADNQDVVNFDATVFAVICAAVDPPLSAAGQAVVDCFAGNPCQLTAENPPFVPVAVETFANALVPPPPEPDPNTALIDSTCRENGPGRQAAVTNVYAYEQTWDQPQADVIITDVATFVAVCHGLDGTQDVISTGTDLYACFLNYAGYLPVYQACYLPGNEINRYLAALLTSSR